MGRAARVSILTSNEGFGFAGDGSLRRSGRVFIKLDRKEERGEAISRVHSRCAGQAVLSKTSLRVCPEFDVTCIYCGLQ